jgi:hypothetical protein
VQRLAGEERAGQRRPPPPPRYCPLMGSLSLAHFLPLAEGADYFEEFMTTINIFNMVSFLLA